jgi:hypothetical protein
MQKVPTGQRYFLIKTIDAYLRNARKSSGEGYGCSLATIHATHPMLRTTSTRRKCRRRFMLMSSVNRFQWNGMSAGGFLKDVQLDILYLFSTSHWILLEQKEHELIHLLCSDPILNSYNFSVFSVLPIYSKLIKAGMRVWLYRSGSLRTPRMSYICAC